MTINVSEALDSDTADLLTIVRSVAGGYIGGLWIPGSTSNIKALISVQQPTPKQLQMLPEGERTKDIKFIVCNKKLQSTDDSNQIIADKILLNGLIYKVIQPGDWIRFGHNTALIVREQV